MMVSPSFRALTSTGSYQSWVNTRTAFMNTPEAPPSTSPLLKDTG